MKIVIIGAGVLGCSIALKIKTRWPYINVVVYERLNGPGLLTSHTNSGVIHSGIHLNPNSLKAKLALEGKRMILAYCRENNIPFRECGMLIVATSSDLWKISTQIPEFFQIMRRAKNWT